jgi:hypothetical protein
VKHAAIFALALALAGCAHSPELAPSAPQPLPTPRALAIDTTPKERRRMVATEAYLRAYLGWFGGLAPLDVQARAKSKNLFDTWDDYLAALGLPDYKIDLPRQSQTNALMLATFGRLGEALCAQAAERDLHARAPAAARVVFAFDAVSSPDAAQFGERFDVLHQLFLGYPARLAPPDRVARYYALYQHVVERHAGAKQPLDPDETAWAAICTALVQHPETGLY